MKTYCITAKLECNFEIEAASKDEAMERAYIYWCDALTDYSEPDEMKVTDIFDEDGNPIEKES